MPTSRHSTFGVRGSGGSGDLRQGNLTSILRYIRDHGSSSRHDIAQGCGLGISTMTDLIAELRSRRLVMELDPIRRPAAGRPTRPIALDGEPWLALGVHLDIDRVRFTAVTVGGREIWTDAVPHDLRGVGAAGYDTVRDIILRGLAMLPRDKELLAVEVGVPGYVERDTGTVTWSAGLDWRDFPLGRLVGDALGRVGIRNIHVGIANDCQLAGLHACRAELGLPSDSIAVYLGGTRGIGSSVIIGGEIYRGAQGSAGDFGHRTVWPGGNSCWCGRDGCLATAAGLAQLVAETAPMSRAEAEAAVDAHPAQAVQSVLDAAAGGEERALATLAGAGDALGYVLDDVIGVINPHTAILGGFLGVLSPYLLPRIEERLGVRRSLAAFAPTAVVGLEKVVPRVARGGALAARDACLNDPLGLTRPLG